KKTGCPARSSITFSKAHRPVDPDAQEGCRLSPLSRRMPGNVEIFASGADIGGNAIASHRQASFPAQKPPLGSAQSRHAPVRAVALTGGPQGGSRRIADAQHTSSALFPRRR